MDEKTAKQLNFRIALILPIIVVFVVVLDSSIGLGLVPRLVTRFCYNSPNPTTVNVSLFTKKLQNYICFKTFSQSQCVLCNYYLFDSTVIVIF